MIHSCVGWREGGSGALSSNVVLGDAQLFSLGNLNQFIEQDLILKVQVPVRL